MANLPEVNGETFDQEVIQADKPVLVDFGAEWCGPCKMLDPLVEELADEWGEAVKVVKVDVDQNPDITIKYQVMGVPTLMLFKNGQIMERMTGYQPKNRLLKKLNPHLEPA